MKISDLLMEAKASIADEANWNKGGWAHEYIEDVDGLLACNKVCAVTALAKACVRHDLVELDFEGPEHTCDCDYCGQAYEESRELEDVMGDFDHPALGYLDAAARAISGGALKDMPSLNDSPAYTHADVLRAYDLAIENALINEAAQDVEVPAA